MTANPPQPAAPLRALCFDAGGTLLRERASRAAIYADVARRHGIEAGEEAVAAAMRATHDALPAQVPGGFRYSRAWFERFIEGVFSRLGCARLPPGLREELFARFADPATFRVFDDVEPALMELRALGLVLGVVSNGSEGLPALLAKLGLAEHFRFILTSASEHLEKPDPEIFRRAAALAGVAPSEAAHVGDHLDRDVAGATAAGMEAFLLDREGVHGALHGGVHGGLQGGVAVQRIVTLLELPAIVRRRIP